MRVLTVRIFLYVVQLSLYCCLLALLSPSAAAQEDAGRYDRNNHSFTYTNPIWESGLRDPTILKVGQLWYLTGTANEEISIWSSNDLHHWKRRQTVAQKGTPKWCQENFWAPEIRHIKGKFYITYNCPEKPGGNRGGAVLVADAILGDYRVLTPDAPIAKPNDTSLFQDDDGKVYSINTGCKLTQVDLDTGKPIPGTTRDVHDPDQPWEGWNEGPTLFKRAGIYHLMYVGVDGPVGPSIGTATAKNIYGPYDSNANNPIYGTAHCRSVPTCPFKEVNHANIFEGPDGKPWLCAFAKLKQRSGTFLVIDPLYFDEQENAKSRVTWTQQRVEW